MLTDLIIKNFAIIESLDVSFSSGFNALTGETGAGKSIVIDAVNLLLGGRARGDVIRTGADDATVEAVFDVSGQDVFIERLHEAGLLADTEFVVRRIISRSGKNRIFINGATVALAQLRDLTGGLVHIYGQNEHQSLQRPETHLSLLDSFADSSVTLECYHQIYRQYLEVQQRRDALNVRERERQQRLDMLKFQKQELEAANLVVDEDLELEQERSLLVHAEKLMAATQGGYGRLYGDQGSVIEAVSSVADSLDNLQGVDPQLDALCERLRSYQYGLDDVATELRKYSAQLDFEPQRRQLVEDRLAQIAGLKRKYAPSLNELIVYLSEITREIDDLEHFDQQRDELDAVLERIRKELMLAGESLTGCRQKAAVSLAQEVERELRELAMGKTRFSVQFKSLEEPTVDGLEHAEFYLAANVGEDRQPLAKVASGGELSRIMLALKRCAPEGDNARTLIFDEVDAGIGGEAATAVGEKIGRLGQRFQVLCVTHLPQVAAFSDHHFKVSKKEAEGRTVTRLRQLDADGRVSEIARMLGGLHAGEQALTHARALIQESRAY